MSNKVDPNLIRDLQHFGLKDANKCYNCGNCTAICELSTPENPFPRKMVRYIQLGQREKILHSPEPWLCYYCGTCTSKCPRGAEPGETMMVLRRYLTSLYDWTGFARKFYTSETFEIAAVSIVGLLVGIGMVFWAMKAPHPNWTQPALNSLWPAHQIEKADLVMAAVLTFFLLSNVYRCVRISLGELWGKIPLRLFTAEAKYLVTHFITQKQFGKCTDRMQWFVHLMIMTGYASVFLMVVVLVNGLYIPGLAFQRDYIPSDYSIFHPIRLVGYYATFAIMYGTTYAIIGRLKKSKPVYKNSHGTDWMFLILLQGTTMTGILVHVFGHLNLVLAMYAIYVLHMMIAIPMLVLEVPFAKWAHLAYRPVVLYLMRVKERYFAEQKAAQPAAAVAAEPAV